MSLYHRTTSAEWPDFDTEPPDPVLPEGDVPDAHRWVLVDVTVHTRAYGYSRLVWTWRLAKYRRRR